MEVEEGRTSILGGEIARRSITGMSEQVSAAYGVIGLGCLLLYFISGASKWMLLADVVILLVTVAVTFEFKGDRSYAGVKVHNIKTRHRHRLGHHAYVNITDEAYGDEDLDPGFELPTPLGRCEPLDLEGTGLDDMFILETRNPGESTYYAVILAVEGLAEGIRGDATWASTSAAFGYALREYAKRSSMIRSIQMVHRAVPADLRPHVLWADHTLAGVPEDRKYDLVNENYAQLLDVIAPESEEHHSYVVLRFNATGRLGNQAAKIARRKGGSYDAGVAAVIRDETIRAVGALRRARLGRVRVYGEQRACAVFRAFIDPSYKLDAHRGARWHTCWPSYIGGKESVVASPRSAQPWHHRVATIRPGDIEPVQLGPLWLAALLTDVEPDPGDEDTPPAPTIRTVSVRMDFVVDYRARDAAKGDVTQDMARQITEAKKEKLGDGSAEVLASASMRRRADLMPGSGNHGVIYSMAIAVTGRDVDDVERACARMTDGLSGSAIREPFWHEDDHDIALFNTLPLCRGMAEAKKYTKEVN